jgi:ferric-dicitrate binding protein FerR (iron transport regulator)
MLKSTVAVAFEKKKFRKKCLVNFSTSLTCRYMMSKKDFERILERYLNNAATDEEIRWIEKWYSSLESENNYPVLTPEEEAIIDQADLENIQKKIAGKKNKTILWPSLAAAAALLIIGVIAIYSLTPDSATSIKNTILSTLTDPEIVNNSDTVKVVWLSDSSQVYLQPNSTIRISSDFNTDDRKVTLTGQAFFNVAHNIAKPFKVFTHDVVTTVLGTSFTINAPSDQEKIIVIVQTGRVAVSSGISESEDSKIKQEVVVTPNQQAVFNPETKELKASLIQSPVVLNIPDKTKEVFDEVPIIDILQKIEKVYGVEILYDAQALANCKITTAFFQEGLYERLDILSKAISATYIVEGTYIVFNSKGCTINP